MIQVVLRSSPALPATSASVSAKGLIKLGHRVVMADLSADRVRERASEAGLQSDSFRALTLDVSQEESANAAIEFSIDEFGALDILVNNAATVTPSCPLAELSVDLWKLAFDVNVTGAWLMSKAAIAHMKPKKSGVILNVSSQLGHVAAPGRGAYSSTKAALHALTRAITADYGDQGIRAVSNFARCDPHDPTHVTLWLRRKSVRSTRRQISGRSSGHCGRRRGDRNVPAERWRRFHQWHRHAGRWWLHRRLIF